MSEKTYINGLFVKVKDGKFGKEIEVSIIADKLIEELQKYKNAKGYVNIVHKERKEPDARGNTHYTVLNEWQKPQDEQPSNNQSQGSNAPDDDLPF